MIMPTPEHWEIFAALLAILVLLASGIMALRRLGILRAPELPAGRDPGSPEIAARLDRHADRITALERAVSGLASHDDIHGLQIAVEKQTGTMREIRAFMDRDTETVARLDAKVTRIEDHLLGEARK